MIHIEDKKNCCGCSACVQVCPKQCISLSEDKEGFLYPHVDSNACINCGLCEKVCPILHQDEPRQPLKVYAAKNKDEEIRRTSSSGGIFTLLAERIIQKGGVVFGARFDEQWEVEHDYTETRERLASFRGSKYTQSRMRDNFKKAKQFLTQGRPVLFTGTPCQIAGLKKYLRKDYEHLFTIDILCHGVPSPGVWRTYLKETIGHESIKQVNFRDKCTGWENYSVSITYTSGNAYRTLYSQNMFMKGFLTDLYLRPSCYQCPAKAGKSGSDLTIADFWAIPQVHPKLDDDKGFNLVLVNSEKGKSLYAEINAFSIETEYEKAKGRNGGFKESIPLPKQREYFFQRYYKKKSITTIIRKIQEPSFYQKMVYRIKRIVKMI